MFKDAQRTSLSLLSPFSFLFCAIFFLPLLLPFHASAVIWTPIFTDTFGRADTATSTGANDTNSVGNGWTDISGGIYNIQSGQLLSTVHDGGFTKRYLARPNNEFGTSFQSRNERVVVTYPAGQIWTNQTRAPILGYNAVSYQVYVNSTSMQITDAATFSLPTVSFPALNSSHSYSIDFSGTYPYPSGTTTLSAILTDVTAGTVVATSSGLIPNSNYPQGRPGVYAFSLSSNPATSTISSFVEYGSIPPTFISNGTSTIVASSVPQINCVGTCTYQWERSTVSGGPYVNVTSGGASTTLTDSGLTPDTDYYYVMVANNGAGQLATSSELYARTLQNVAMVPILNDNFNRANGAVGNGWTAPNAPGIWNIINNTLVASSTKTGNLSNALIRPSSENTLNQRMVITYPAGVSATSTLISASLRYNDDFHTEQSYITYSGQFCVRTTCSNLTIPYSVNHSYTIDFSAIGSNPTELDSFLTDNTAGAIVAFASSTDSTASTIQNSSGYALNEIFFQNVPYGELSSVKTYASFLLSTNIPGAPRFISGSTSTLSLTSSPATGGTAPYTYKWLRSTVSGGPYTLVSGSASTTVNDSGLTPNTNYYYVMTAVDASSSAATSTEIQLRTQSTQSTALNFVTIGDSIMGSCCNVSGAPENVFQNYLASTTHYVSVALHDDSQGGLDSTSYLPGNYWANRALADIGTYGISSAMVMLGSNDQTTAKRTSQAQYLANMQATVNSLLAAGIRQIFISNIPYLNYVTASSTTVGKDGPNANGGAFDASSTSYGVLYNAVLGSLDNGTSVHHIGYNPSIYTVTQSAPYTYLTDGTHLTTAGVNLLGNEWGANIDQILSPNSIALGTSTILQNSTNNSITLTGINTVWTPGTPGSPIFTISGGSASITSQNVTSTTSATLTISAGTTTGPVIITDPSTGATTSLAVVGDTIAPLVNITAPSGGSNVSGNVTLTTTSSDNVGVVSVQFAVDGSNIGASGTSSPYSVVWNSGSVADGAHTITAVARDAAGNAATSTITNVMTHNTAPVITLLATSTTPTIATITWTTNNAASSTVLYGATTAYGSASSSSALVTSHSIILSGLTPTTIYHFIVGGSDAYGNTSTSSDRTFSTASNVVPPTLSVQSATSVATSTATLNGTITADGFASSSVEGFAYGLTTAYGATTSNSGTFGVGAFAKTLSGLTPGTVYHFQSFATNSAGTGTSSDQTFTTSALPPPAITSIASSTTQTTVTITWVTDQAASSTVNYGGTTSYGTASTSAALVTTHTIVISGLSASTSYHYQISGANSAGTISTSTDLVFTTLAPAAVIPTVSVQTATSIGTSTATLNGTITADGFASSTVEGFTYGLTTAYGATTSNSGTFGMGSFSKTISGLIATTLYHFRAFSTNSAGTGTSGDMTFTTATPADVTPPSVTLTAPSSGSTVHGTTTLSAVSSDNVGVTGVQFEVDGTNIGASGTSSPYSVVWNSIGVIDGSHTLSAVASDAAGNVATSSVTVTVDNTPPARSAGTPTGTLPENTSTTTVSLTTNENAVCRYSLSAGTAYSSMLSFSTTGSTTHMLPVTGLSNAGSYVYYVKCSDVSGNTNSSDYTISFTVAADMTSPTVSILTPANNAFVFGNAVSITATATDDVSVAGVQFQLDGANLGSLLTSAPYATTWDSTSVVDGSHSLVAIAHDGSGNYSTSSVVTVKVDNTPPVVSNGNPSGSVSFGTTATLISVNTDENATCKYSTTAGQAYGSMTTFGTTGAKAHSQSVGGLSDGNAYTYYVKCQDQRNNIDPSDYTITFNVGVSTVPPVISSVSSGVPGQTSATITWNTDQSSDSQVNYGTTNSYGQSTTLDPTLVTSHSVYITGLSAGTTYDYQVLSKDSLGNLATSTNQSFTTTATPPPVSSGGGGGSSSSRGGGSAVNYGSNGAVLGTTGTTTSVTITIPPISPYNTEVDASLFTRNLTLTSQGTDVIQLQEFLIAKGFLAPGFNSGYFGALTQKALAAYQAAQGIVPASGFFGPLTRAEITGNALQVTTSSTVTSSPVITSPVTTISSSLVGGSGGSLSTCPNMTVASNSSCVTLLQQYLNSHGFTVALTGAGSVGEETSYFGNATQAALAKFQASQGISPAVGYFGSITRAAMMR